MPQYFVLAKTLWEGDSWSPIAVFSSREEADNFADDNINHGMNEYNRIDMKRIVETQVLTKTKMKKIYKINEDEALEAIAYIQYRRDSYLKDDERP